MEEGINQEERSTWVSTIVTPVAFVVYAIVILDRTDERDKAISKHGEYIGFYVLSVGMVGALALAMVEADHFWIANAIYLAFALSSTVASVVKIAAYRRGF